MAIDQSWIAGLLGGVQNVQANGSALPARKSINLKGAGLVSAVDNPTNNSTDLTLGGGAGGTTSTSSSFTQPSVWTAASPTNVVVAIANASAAIQYETVTINGVNNYVQISASFVSPITLINVGGNGSQVAPGGTVASGSTVTFGGSILPLAAATPLNGQSAVVKAGALVYTGTRERLNCAMANPSGDGTADDWAALQSVLDKITVAGSQVEVILPRSSAAQFTAGTQSASFYALSQPLVMNDGGFWAGGNFCDRFRGEHQQSVGLVSTWTGFWQSPNWIGPLLIVGSASDTTQVTYVTDTGMKCAVGGVSQVGSPVLNFSEWDVGFIHGQTAFCWEEWYNPLTESGAGVNRELASSCGSIGFEQHLAFSIRRFNGGTGAQIIGSLAVTAGSGTTTTTGAQTMPPGGQVGWPTPTTLTFASTAAMTLALANLQDGPASAPPWLTITGIGVLELLSVTDATHAVVRNPGFGRYTSNVAPGTAIPNGTAVAVEGNVIVFTSAGHDLPASTLSHIALDWDGTSLRLWVNGAQPDGTMTKACSGTIVQRWYEETVTMQSRYISWPSANGGLFGASGSLFHQGLTRLSNVSRYISGFTPTPASVTCDSGCKLLIDWTKQTPASNSFSSRSSLQNGFLIARTGAQYRSINRTNMPVWLNMNITQVPYTSGAEVSHMALVGNYGLGIDAVAALHSNFHHLNFSALQKGINFRNFSFSSSVHKLIFDTCGSGLPGGYHGWNILLGQGAQDMTVGDDVNSTNCSTTWHTVCMFSQATFGKSFISGQSMGAIACVVGAGVIFDHGLDIDDEGGVMGYAPFLLGVCESFRKVAGSVFTLNTSIPTYKMGAVGNFECDAVVFNGDPSAIFSGGAINGVANTPCPAKWSGLNGHATTVVIDPQNPTPVYIPAQESFGVKTITFPSDANYVVPQGTYDAFWREYLIAANIITAPRTLTWPSNPGKIYVGRNNNAQSVTLKTNSGAAGVTVASGATFKVQDQSTGMVIL